MAVVAAGAAAGAGAKYAKDNPDQAKAGALILLVGGLFLFNRISGTLDGLKGIGDDLLDVGDAVVRGTEKTADGVGNFFEGMFTGAETDYRIDSEIEQPLGGASKEHLAEFQGMEYEDYQSIQQYSFVPGRYKVDKSGGDYSRHVFITEEDDYRYNYSTPLAIVTTADLPGGGESAGGRIFDHGKGLIDRPITAIPFTDIHIGTDISFGDIGNKIKGWFN